MTQYKCPMFAAVRCTEGREWVDVETTNFIGTVEAMQKANYVDKKLGSAWAKDNPVVRLVRLDYSDASSLPPFKVKEG